MSEEVKIVAAETSDAAAILSNQIEAYGSGSKIWEDPRIPPTAKTVVELKKEFQTYRYLKAVVGTELVGAVRACESDGSIHIGRLIVRPEWQNRGIGTALMKAIEASFPNASRFEIFTSEGSQKNRAYYGRLGWREFKTVVINSELSLVYLEKLVPSQTESIYVQ